MALLDEPRHYPLAQCNENSLVIVNDYNNVVVVIVVRGGDGDGGGGDNIGLDDSGDGRSGSGSRINSKSSVQ